VLYLILIVANNVSSQLAESMGKGTVSVIEPFSKQQFSHEITVRTLNALNPDLNKFYALLNTHGAQVFAERADDTHDTKEIVFGVTKNGLVKVVTMIEEQFGEHNWTVNVKTLDKVPVTGTGQGRL